MNIERGLVKTRLCYMHYRAAGKVGAEAIFLQHINQQSSALYLELMAALCPALRVVELVAHGSVSPAAWLSRGTQLGWLSSVRWLAMNRWSCLSMDGQCG